MEKREDFEVTGIVNTADMLKGIIGASEGNVELLDVLKNFAQIIEGIDKDSNMKNIEKEKLCNQLLEYIQQRITVLKEFFESSYILRWKSSVEEEKVFLEKFKKLNEDDEKLYLSYAINRLEEHFMSDIKINIDKFLDKQYMRLEAIKEDIGFTDRELHNKKGIIFHNEIRDTLNLFVQIYNQVLKDIKDRQLCIKEEEIENIYTDIDEIVVYKNYAEKMKKLQQILNKIHLNGHRTIKVYLDKNDDKQIQNIDIHDMCCVFLNGRLINEKSIYKQLEWEYEVFDIESGDVFAAQIQMSHIIFLLEISEHLRRKLAELQTRCNIKYYYFSKIDQEYI